MGRPRIKAQRRAERVTPEDYAALFTPQQLRELRNRRQRRPITAAADALTRWEQSRPLDWENNPETFGKWINTPPPRWLDADALRRWDQRRAEILADWGRNAPAAFRELNGETLRRWEQERAKVAAEWGRNAPAAFRELEQKPNKTP